MSAQQLTDENTSRIRALIDEYLCCPICLGMRSFIVYGDDPLDQLGVFNASSYFICPTNRYHILSALVVSSPRCVLISFMDKLDRP
jgi:hypothetical protein